MRIVGEPPGFRSAFDAARREAQKAFGDARVFLEKYIEEPRHVEFQVLADMHGSTIHLFERECSIQRRHQKVIEEAPSPVMTGDLRERMGIAAVEAARSVGYVGAGTVEFLVDRERNFYFMEMNTRLQVEHAVTEWITGLDLVREQIRAAEGHPLERRQEDVSVSGHAIECRVYAEDPSAGFLPAPGTLRRHHAPAGFGVRVDAGVEQGDEVTVHYDPMISKVTTWGATRDEAVDRMVRALREYEIAGVPTTIPFCLFVLRTEAFRSGSFSTHFIANHFNGDTGRADDDGLDAALARSAAVLWAEDGRGDGARPDEGGGWTAGFSDWRRNRLRHRRRGS
jgi:propionyl-CoA carboxylase alpha chain